MATPSPPKTDAVREAEDRAGSHAFGLSSDLLGSASADGYFTALNPAWEKTLGFDNETLMGRPFLDFVHPADREATVAEMARLGAERTGPEVFENRYSIKSGGWCWLSWEVEVCDEAYYFVARDVTARIVTDQRGALLANIVEGIDDAIVTKTTDGVITSWNHASEELYGFTEAEAVGQSMADLIVPEAYAHEPMAIIKRLLEGQGVRQYTTQRQHKNGTKLTVSLTASLMRDAAHKVVGVAVISRDISQNDLEGVGAHSELNAMVWVGRIRDAIDEDRMCFYAQPIIDLEGQVKSYELLCRIVDRNGGIVAPGLFLPAAESYDLIEELDLLAIEEAARRIAQGHRVHINLSTASVGRWHIVDAINDMLATAEADPSLLTIEITETALMKNMATAERFASGISELGCRVALDDFGTGFGGFIYLKKMQIDQLKIDVEFIRDLCSSNTSQHVVKAVVSLAQGMGLETVAEGVEDEETFALLSQYGVTYAQGYFFARSAPSDDVLGRTDQ